MLLRLLSVSLRVAPEQHAAKVGLRVGEARTSAHPLVHLYRLLEVSRGVVEATQLGGEEAERPAGGIECELGHGGCVERAVGQQELVQGSGMWGVFEDCAGLGEQADAAEPLLVHVPVGQVAPRELLEEGLRFLVPLPAGVDVSENGPVHER